MSPVKLTCLTDILYLSEHVGFGGMKQKMRGEKPSHLIT